LDRRSNLLHRVIGSISSIRLENNYEQHFDESTPKQDVYNEYSDFCKKHRIEPTSASAFGRLVRLAFPATTSRRLGARGANVTVYNHFRRREDADSRSIQLTALSQQPPSPSGPPSLNSLDGDNRLRGGGSSKGADGRTGSVEDLKQGRTSSLNGQRSSIDDASRMDQIDDDELDESLYKGANSGFDGVDGLLDQGFLSLAGRQQSTCTTPSASTNAGLASIIFDEYQYDALEGGASGANLLMKMLKSEENGAELYDSLHRMLYGARAYHKDGMELEEEAARINADADAAGTVHHLALFPITHHQSEHWTNITQYRQATTALPRDIPTRTAAPDHRLPGT
jgi:hypothetical protein